MKIESGIKWIRKRNKLYGRIDDERTDKKAKSWRIAGV
jgi:hypothetical protein